ncbi:hypothetical protein ACJJH9_15770 [Microbulbifer sp. DLAB2-AF]|uniref:hypothetical protein n=1 Tax=Microbulbifer sp. DLAB2-AF TaxID=3243395 RepID=UPI00403956DA
MKEAIKNPSAYRIYGDRLVNAKLNYFDQIYSFVLSKSLPKNLKERPVLECDIEPRHMHNILIGIDSGHHSYRNENSMDYTYPIIWGDRSSEQVWYELENDGLPSNFSIFLTSLFNHCQVATLLELDVVHYITDSWQK